MEHLHIQTFGNFILQAGNAKISDSDNRSKKVWLLLAYILCKWIFSWIANACWLVVSDFTYVNA